MDGQTLGNTQTILQISRAWRKEPDTRQGLELASVHG